MKQKILHIISQQPGKTGSGVFFNSIIEEAHKNGYVQSIIVGIPSFELEYIGRCYSYASFYPVCFEEGELDFPVPGMSDVMPYKSTKYKDMTSDMLDRYIEAFKTKIKHAVDIEKPDLIISHHLWLVTALTAEIVNDIPIIAICHGTDIRQLQQNPQYGSYVINKCRKLNCIGALSNNQKEDIVKLYGIAEDKIKVIGGGYNSEVFYNKKSAVKESDAIRLVYAGKLSYSKGIPYLIKAYSMLDHAASKLELILVGSGEGKEFDFIKLMALSCPYKMTLMGAVPQKELGEIFRSSDIFVLPSFYEGLGLVVIEALASGMRVVCTELSGIKEKLGDEVAEKGYIKYVKLPSITSVDIPGEDEIDEFICRLVAGLQQQIDVVKGGSVIESNFLDDFQAVYSWGGVFMKLEEIIGSLDKKGMTVA